MSRYRVDQKPTCPICRTEKICDRQSKKCQRCARNQHWFERDLPQPPAPDVPPQALADDVLAMLRKAPTSILQIASVLKVSQGRALDTLLSLKEAGHNIYDLGGQWSLEKQIQAGAGKVEPYVSRPDGSYLFGVCGDTHLCSKYERLDCLGDIYRRFAAAGVDRVFHTGNWVDGEARFNKFDLKVHGTQQQIDYFVEHYPRRDDFVTYAVTGDDHEGWLAQREGVDIGRLLERCMQDAGRSDWVNLGYMEAYVPLQHAQTGKQAMLHVIHPGGGSAYATSYTVQKLVESYEGGQKPAVLIAGHYHKLEFIEIRNVWVLQSGCFQDQTPFARKKRLHYTIGGAIMRLTQNPETGAIEHAGVDFYRYFDKGYYDNQRWSYHGDVVLPPRVTA